MLKHITNKAWFQPSRIGRTDCSTLAALLAEPLLLAYRPLSSSWRSSRRPRCRTCGREQGSFTAWLCTRRPPSPMHHASNSSNHQGWASTAARPTPSTDSSPISPAPWPGATDEQALHRRDLLRLRIEERELRKPARHLRTPAHCSVDAHGSEVGRMPSRAAARRARPPRWPGKLDEADGEILELCRGGE